MMFKFSPARIARAEEPLRSDDIFTTTCLIRDELRKMEERCSTTKAKGGELKQKRDEMAEVLRLLQTIEENEKRKTEELRTELNRVQEGQQASFVSRISGASVADDPQVFSSDQDNELASSTLSTLPTGVSLPGSRGAPGNWSASLLDTSSPNKAGTALSLAWRQKLSSFIKDSGDAPLFSLASAANPVAGTVSTCDRTQPSSPPRKRNILRAVTSLRLNATNVLSAEGKISKNDTNKTKYGVGPHSKLPPRKSCHTSRKPIVPTVFSKARQSLKRKTRPRSKLMEIGEPYNFRKVAGTSDRFGVPTLETVKGSEKLDSHTACFGFGNAPQTPSVAIATNHG